MQQPTEGYGRDRERGNTGYRPRGRVSAVLLSRACRVPSTRSISAPSRSKRAWSGRLPRTGDQRWPMSAGSVRR